MAARNPVPLNIPGTGPPARMSQRRIRDERRETLVSFVTTVAIVHMARVSLALAGLGLVAISQSAATTQEAPAGAVSYIEGGSVVSKGRICLFAAPLDGTRLRRLVCGSLGRFGERLEDDEGWSPDGSWLAFTESGTSPGVYVVGADGNGVRRLAVTTERETEISRRLSLEPPGLRTARVSLSTGGAGSSARRGSRSDSASRSLP
jgi:hypothetical protein